MSILRKLSLLLLAATLLGLIKPLPKVFLIGDSISVQYGPYLQKYTEGIMEVNRKKDDGKALKNLDVPAGSNGGDSRMVLEYLRAKFGDPTFRPDYLLVNCGLHDIKTSLQTGERQISEKNYRDNLDEIFSLLKKEKVTPIWITTTAVVDTIHNSRSRQIKRYASDVDRYGKIATEVCMKHNIQTIDLYDFTWKLGIEQFTDHVHYKEPARALQAAFIAGQLAAIVGNTKK
jgi:lysophospholipase L1-like esterase